MGREPAIDLPVVAERHHNHQENLVADGIDDAIVAHSYPKAGATSNCSGRGFRRRYGTCPTERAAGEEPRSARLRELGLEL